MTAIASLILPPAWMVGKGGFAPLFEKMVRDTELMILAADMPLIRPDFARLAVTIQATLVTKYVLDPPEKGEPVTAEGMTYAIEDILDQNLELFRYGHTDLIAQLIVVKLALDFRLVPTEPGIDAPIGTLSWEEVVPIYDARARTRTILVLNAYRHKVIDYTDRGLGFDDVSATPIGADVEQKVG